MAIHFDSGQFKGYTKHTKKEPYVYLVMRVYIIILERLFIKCNMETRLKKSLENCAICMEKVVHRGKIDSCQHFFCRQCIQSWSEVPLK